MGGILKFEYLGFECLTGIVIFAGEINRGT